jgi:flagellar operon protein
MIGPQGPQLTRITPSSSGVQGNGSASGISFSDLFQQTIQKPETEQFRISAHAQKRLSERNIAMNPDLQQNLNKAFSELEAKGAKDSLVVTREGAFVVNVPSRTLVTAMGIDEMRNGIVTNIDSVSMKYG